MHIMCGTCKFWNNQFTANNFSNFSQKQPTGRDAKEHRTFLTLITDTSSLSTMLMKQFLLWQNTNSRQQKENLHYE